MSDADNYFQIVRHFLVQHEADTFVHEALNSAQNQEIRERAALVRIAAATTDHAVTKEELRDFMVFAGNEARKATE